VAMTASAAVDEGDVPAAPDAPVHVAGVVAAA